MSAYSELVKNFEKIRDYMRDFYVYGFKSRGEYDRKSARSYDNERRRMESWLGDYMQFSRTAEGKAVFLSLDSRAARFNPFFRAWKAKSFTDGDITLHFILFDLLGEDGEKYTLGELTEKIDGYLGAFDNPLTFDESTIRKKLKEYVAEGIVLAEKRGRQVCYRRAPSPALPSDTDALHFFSEVAPCGVVGSFLLDKQKDVPGIFSFKHHYVTHTVDSEVLAALFDAMGKKSCVTLTNRPRRGRKETVATVLPLKVLISVQSGRQHLLAYHMKMQKTVTYRIDYVTHVELGEVCPDFEGFRRLGEQVMGHLWGVSVREFGEKMDRVEFVLRVAPEDEHVVRRLYREKRCGTVEKIDDGNYLFSATVSDGLELIPWVRTFLSRITAFSCSDPAVEELFRSDLKETYGIYFPEEGAE